MDNKKSFVHDKLGWIDDFRALPGECGQPLTRKIYAKALLSQGKSIEYLKTMGFTKDYLEEVLSQMLEDSFDEKR